MSRGIVHQSISNGVTDLLGTVTGSGTYFNTSYLSSTTMSNICFMAQNTTLNRVGIYFHGTSNTGYEHALYTLDSAPAGITLSTIVCQSAGTSSPIGSLYVAILNGVTAKINVAMNFKSINASPDTMTVGLTVTYA